MTPETAILLPTLFVLADLKNGQKLETRESWVLEILQEQKE